MSMKGIPQSIPILCSKMGYAGKGGSNEYPQCMFWTKTRKLRYTPANPTEICYIKVGFKGAYILRTCIFLMIQSCPDTVTLFKN